MENTLLQAYLMRSLACDPCPPVNNNCSPFPNMFCGPCDTPITNSKEADSIIAKYVASSDFKENKGIEFLYTVNQYIKTSTKLTTPEKTTVLNKINTHTDVKGLVEADPYKYGFATYLRLCGKA